MATMRLRVRGVLAPAPASLLAMADSVSPRWTTCIDSPSASLPAALARAGGAPLGGLDSGAAAVGAAAAGAGAGSPARAIAPSRLPAPVAGALTGEPDTADWPGVYTGGSSSMVYSRTRWPRAQFT